MEGHTASTQVPATEREPGGVEVEVAAELQQVARNFHRAPAGGSEEHVSLEEMEGMIAALRCQAAASTVTSTGVAAMAQQTPIADAAYNNNTAEVTRLLQKSLNIGEGAADIDAKKTVGGGDSKSALLWASQFGSTEIVRMLLSYGADVASTDHRGNTALHLAAWKGETDCVCLLLQSGADREARNEQSQTPLERSRASERGHAEEMSTLFQNPSLCPGPVAACAKERPTMKTWPARCAKIEGSSLNFYDEPGMPEVQKRGSSIVDLSGVTVECGEEEFSVSWQRVWFKITLYRKGHTNGLPDLDDAGYSRFAFKTTEERDRFAAALSNLAAGRLWADDGSGAAGAASVDFMSGSAAASTPSSPLMAAGGGARQQRGPSPVMDGPPSPPSGAVDKAPPAVAVGTAVVVGAAVALTQFVRVDAVAQAVHHEEVAVSVGVGQSCSNDELAAIGISKMSVGNNFGLMDYEITFTNTTRDAFGFTDAEGNTYKNTAFRLGSHSVTYSSRMDRVQDPTIVKVTRYSTEEGVPPASAAEPAEPAAPAQQQQLQYSGEL